jgi:hypothetical protein
MTRPERMASHYSGDLSREFWKRVNALPAQHRASAYAAGVLLQNMESTVLDWLRNGESVAPRRRSALRRQAPKGGGR